MMKTTKSIIVGLFFAFSLLFCSGSSIRAQEEKDDPNWRERKLERLKKEMEELRKQLEEAEKELEKISAEFPNPHAIWNSRFLDIYDYGPIHQKRRRNEVRHYHPVLRRDG